MISTAVSLCMMISDGSGHVDWWPKPVQPTYPNDGKCDGPAFPVRTKCAMSRQIAITASGLKGNEILNAHFSTPNIIANRRGGEWREWKDMTPTFGSSRHITLVVGRLRDQ